MSRITRRPHPFEHFQVDLLNANDDELMEIRRVFGLGLSLEELHYIQNHYLIRERKATDVELKLMIKPSANIVATRVSAASSKHLRVRSMGC